MRTRLLSLLAAATVAALLSGTAHAQQYRGYSRPGNYTPGNYGMTRSTGYAPSNYGMMRPSGYVPSNFGNPGASIPANAGGYETAGAGTPVPVGALRTLPGTPVGPAMFPSSVASFPAGTPPPPAQATYPGAPQLTPGELATLPQGAPQPAPAEQVPPPGGLQGPTPDVNAIPAAPPAPVNLGAALTSPFTTPGATMAVNPSGAAFSTGPALASPFRTTSPSYLGYPSGTAVYGSYAAGQYPSSFSSALGRVYGYR